MYNVRRYQHIVRFSNSMLVLISALLRGRISQTSERCNAKLITTSLTFLEVWQHQYELIIPTKTSW